MKRNALPSLSFLAPSFSEGDFQNDFAISRPSRISLNCSQSFTKMMYQLPIDMITRMISVPLETKSPWRQSASRP
jgi:hypothetical protein